MVQERGGTSNHAERLNELLDPFYQLDLVVAATFEQKLIISRASV
jgi:hypothetical protein